MPQICSRVAFPCRYLILWYGIFSTTVCPLTALAATLVKACNNKEYQPLANPVCASNISNGRGLPQAGRRLEERPSARSELAGKRCPQFQTDPNLSTLSVQVWALPISLFAGWHCLQTHSFGKVIISFHFFLNHADKTPGCIYSRLLSQLIEFYKSIGAAKYMFS